jgi:Holliday junction resolvase RusA-like endonuclease
LKISFFVPGEPKTAGSKKAFCIKKGGVYTGRAIVTDDTGQAGKDWRAGIVATAFEAMRAADTPPLNEPLILRAEFIMPRPKSHYKSSGFIRDDAPVVHSIRPDATKLVRALEDALSNVLWRDDAAVCEQYVFKLYGDQPGCKVTITTYASESVLRKTMAGSDFALT